MRECSALARLHQASAYPVQLVIPFYQIFQIAFDQVKRLPHEGLVDNDVSVVVFNPYVHLHPFPDFLPLALFDH